MQKVRAFLVCRAGTTAMEYGIIGLFAAVAGIMAFGSLGDVLKTTFDTVASVFPIF